MKLTEAMAFVSDDDLFLVNKDGNLYLVSEYRLGKEDFDYGIYDSCSIAHSNELELPAFMVDEFLEDLFQNVFPMYGVKEFDLQTLHRYPVEEWGHKFASMGYDNPDLEHYISICRCIVGETPFEPFTEEELESFKTEDTFVKQCIDKHVRMYRDMGYDVIK